MDERARCMHGNDPPAHHHRLAMLWGDGLLLIALAAFTFSLSNLATKSITLHAEVPIFQLSGTVSAFCLMGMSTIVQFRGEKLRPEHAHVLALCMLRGLLGAAAITLLYLSMQKLILRDAVTLFFTSPVMVAVGERLLRPHESPSPLAFMACLLTVLGVWLVSQPDCLQHSELHAVGIMLACSAAAANAAAFLTIRFIGQSVPAAVLTWW